MSNTIRIAMWSGPRNISTAMMRAWEARADCAVVDEPFYGAYLTTTGLDHPMRREILAQHPTDWDEIARACAQSAAAPVLYQKHMCQHMIPEAPLAWMSGVRHAFLIRPPAEVARSFAAKMEAVTAEDLGFRRQAELFHRATDCMGALPPVIEARDVLTNPEGMLRALCTGLDVRFDPAMLSWAPGRRDSDGVWAAHWYHSVEQSTGFAAPGAGPGAGPNASPTESRNAPSPVSPELAAIIAECQPFYDEMAARKLKPVPHAPDS